MSGCGDRCVVISYAEIVSEAPFHGVYCMCDEFPKLMESNGGGLAAAGVRKLTLSRFVKRSKRLFNLRWSL